MQPLGKNNQDDSDDEGDDKRGKGKRTGRNGSNRGNPQRSPDPEAEQFCLLVMSQTIFPCFIPVAGRPKEKGKARA